MASGPEPSTRNMDSSLVLKYSGSRFMQAAMPLSCLGELASLQDAVNELYRARILTEHGRVRAPKGYKDEVVLALTQVQAGSTVLTLEAPPRISPHQLNLQSPLESAIDDLLGFLKDGSLPAGSNQQVMARCVKNLGASLYDDEEISFQGSRRASRYNQDVRRQLLQSLKEPFSRKEERVFAVSEQNKRGQSFELCTPQDQVVKIGYPTDEQSRLVLEGAFAGWQSVSKNRKVLVAGDFFYSPEGRLISIEPSTIEALEERDLRWRIPFLRHRVAEAGDRVALDLFEAEWSNVGMLIGEHPYLYILEPGVLSAEWDHPAGEISMTVDGSRIALLQLGTEEDEAECDSFAAAADWVAQRLAR